MIDTPRGGQIDIQAANPAEAFGVNPYFRCPDHRRLRAGK